MADKNMLPAIKSQIICVFNESGFTGAHYFEEKIDSLVKQVLDWHTATDEPEAINPDSVREIIREFDERLNNLLRNK